MSPPSSFKAKLDAVKAEHAKTVQQFKSSASTDASRLKDRYHAFEEFRKSMVAKVLEPKLKELAAEFPGIKSDLDRDVDRGQVTLSFPRTPDRSALIEVILSLAHDDAFEKVLFGYELRIIPVFIEFDKTSELVLTLDKPDLAKLSDWLDNCLVGFAKTYYAMQFVEQYQSGDIATDPVLNRRFPKGMAVGSHTHENVEYFFASEESKKMFTADPAKYVRIG